MQCKKQFQWSLIVMILFSLTGCRTGGDQMTIIRKDSSLFSFNWNSVSPVESSISIRNDKNEVIRRLALHKPKRNIFTEAMLLKHGNMTFERRKKIAVGKYRKAEDELLQRYNKSNGFAKLGVKLNPDNVKQKENKEGDITYAVTQGETHKCIAFFRYSKKSRPPTESEPGIYEAITGASCVPKQGDKAASLENDVLDLASRVVFDNGRLARAKLFEVGLRQLDEDQRGPEIIAPYELNTKNPTVLIMGQLKDETGFKSLAWDDREIAFEEDGKFNVELPVPEGQSKITLTAVDTLDNSSSIDVFVVRGEIEEDLTPGKQYALLIGISIYQDERIAPLETTIHDVQAVSKALLENFGYAVTVVKNSSRAEILAAIEREKTKLKKNDDFIIYYSGHGIQDKKGIGYWIPSDGLPDSANSWLSNIDIVSQLRQIISRRVLMVSDSCFSGTLTAETISQPPSFDTVRSRTAMSSGGIEPVDDDDGSGHSPFARHLMNVLKQKRGQDITAFSVFHEVKRLVMRGTTQTPQYGGIPGAGHVAQGGYYF